MLTMGLLRCGAAARRGERLASPERLGSTTIPLVEGNGGRASLVGALLACGVIAATGCGSDRQGVETRDPERTFAPLVRLDPKEKWLPMGAGWLINRSALWFAQDGACRDNKIAVGRKLQAQWTGAVNWIFPAGMGEGPYAYKRDSYGATCRDRRPYIFFANQKTRPNDAEERVKGLGLTGGYYLDVMDWARGGQPLQEGRVAAPAYVERHAEDVDGEPGLRLTYWLLYGMNEPHGPGGPIDRLTHEGDWERIDVLLQDGDDPDEHVPVAVRLHDGGAQRDVPWESVRRGGPGSAHPVMSAARGDHTLSATTRGGDCARCPQWRTWTELADARKQPWYGFGGAWGKPGATEETTGPVGPHGKWAPDSRYDP